MVTAPYLIASEILFLFVVSFATARLPSPRRLEWAVSTLATMAICNFAIIGLWVVAITEGPQKPHFDLAPIFWFGLICAVLAVMASKIQRKQQGKGPAS